MVCLDGAQPSPGRFEYRVFLLLDRLSPNAIETSLSCYLPIAGGEKRIHTFPKEMNAMDLTGI